MNNKNKITITITTISILAALLFACTTNEITPEKYSGFLSDYSALKPSKNDKDMRVYLRPGVNWQQYDSLMIDKVAIVPSSDMTVTHKEIFTEVADEFQKLLISHLSTQLNVVAVEGTHTLRLEAAITGVYESFDDLRGYQFIPVAAVVTGISRGTGISKKKARMMSEGKLVDAATGTILAEVIDLKAGKVIQKEGQPVTLSDLEPVLEIWATRITQKLMELKELAAHKNKLEIKSES
jgi:hypothetical protein